MSVKRRLPVGAEPGPEGVGFRVWAPKRRHVEIVTEVGEPQPPGQRAWQLAAEGDGYFSGTVTGMMAGETYSFRLDGSEIYPDPASRFQPQGPDGPSQVVDPAAYRWTDQAWPGIRIEGQAIYEAHIGTLTPEGTWDAARLELAAIGAAGFTVLEVMPVAEFAGRWGWGYDGVALYAPYHRYGNPDSFRRFVDAAHACGLGVLLDVVYNHFGPDGCCLTAFSDHYLDSSRRNEWGDAINFDGPMSGPVREYMIENAGYWISEYHLDGLRIDATQTMEDRSERHVLAEITRKARAAAGSRSIVVIGENEPQHASLVQPVEEGGCGFDGLWNDDLHHSMMVALTGRNEAYYSDHRGTADEFVSAARFGFLFQGQRYDWQKKRRGMPAFGLHPASFVAYLENHDQLANSGRGQRVHRQSGPGRYRAMTALLLLGPWTPMVFQGQEFGASTPFLYFADHNAELSPKVREGRSEFLAQFPSLATPAMQALLADPAAEATFLRSKLNPRERDEANSSSRLYRDLLRLRREDPAFAAQRPGGIEAAVISDEAFVLRFMTRPEMRAREADRLLVVNLGRDMVLPSVAQPLLAPPAGCRWSLLWSSEDPAYGGNGAPEPEVEGVLRFQGHAAVVLSPAREPAGGRQNVTEGRDAG